MQEHVPKKLFHTLERCTPFVRRSERIKGTKSDYFLYVSSSSPFFYLLFVGTKRWIEKSESIGIGSKRSFVGLFRLLFPFFLVRLQTCFQSYLQPLSWYVHVNTFFFSFLYIFFKGRDWQAGDILTVFFCVQTGAMAFGQISPYITAVMSARGAAFNLFQVRKTYHYVLKF